MKYESKFKMLKTLTKTTISCIGNTYDNHKKVKFNKKAKQKRLKLDYSGIFEVCIGIMVLIAEKQRSCSILVRGVYADMVCATFMFSREEDEKLKKWVSLKCIV